MLLTKVTFSTGINFIKDLQVMPYTKEDKKGVRIYFEVTDPLADPVQEFQGQVTLFQRDAEWIGDPVPSE